MFGRTPRAALAGYLVLLEEALLCCWTHVHLTVDRKAAEADPRSLHALALAGFEQLPFLHAEFALRMAQSFTFDQDLASGADMRWRVTLRQYSYAIELVSANEEEVLAWHWQPAGEIQSDASAGISAAENLSDAENARLRDEALTRRPHVHIATGQLAGYHLSRKQHIPTGHVLLEDVLRFAIEELNVTPARADWQARLARARERSSAALL